MDTSRSEAITNNVSAARERLTKDPTFPHHTGRVATAALPSLLPQSRSRAVAGCSRSACACVVQPFCSQNAGAVDGHSRAPPATSHLAHTTAPKVLGPWGMNAAMRCQALAALFLAVLLSVARAAPRAHYKYVIDDIMIRGIPTNNVFGTKIFLVGNLTSGEAAVRHKH